MTVQLTQEQFQELLGRISAIHSSANMNFTQCAYRFHGERDHMKVDEFINAVTAFKQLEQIPDEDALFGLPLLLKDAASTWWAAVRSDVNSWTEALDRIRSEFAPTPPPYEVYLQIFANPQGGIEDIDDFLMGKNKLLRMLPAGRHSEEVQLDLVYGLLRLDFRKEIRRTDVKTFAELSERVRHMESLIRTGKFKSLQPSITKPLKKRCSFCRMKGHTVELCRRRKVRLAQAELDMKTNTTTSTTDKPAEVSSLRSSERRMARLIEAELKQKAEIAATLMAEPKVDTQIMSPTSTVDSTVASPMSPVGPVADSPMSPPPAVADSPMSPPVVDSPMSPTTTDDEEPSIYCFGCGAPNVWRSICAKCKNA